ncbi:hypothetical protein FB565_007436 [Actinoplanes lutulentus]|uniref:VCBS repeat protein n=1 Tax=Actinoplanes lutulentus TaxID=1287878 RepID=A0A327Z0P1_9ACTN|nr:VCBS repeat-containing protein [Actinoplanes lutulentus]MBB2947665.1 hypothetical protein [Actinoplanes lutulentus]RAK27721.1 hypothetical protein B0I29_122104 [Actinoplanes lutulentus]
MLRLLKPFVRTRTRLTVTVGFLAAALVAALLPWWPQSEPSPPDSPVTAAPIVDKLDDEALARAEAEKTGKDVLITSATTATSQTWVQGNGKLRTQTSALPQRARNAQGEWAPIDTTLVRDGDTIAPVNGPVPVTLSTGSDENDSVLATVGDIEYTWPGKLPEPVLDGPRALYPEVLPGVDLLIVTIEEGGIAHVLVVKTKQAAAKIKTLSYGLTSTTAVFRHDKVTGGVLIQDAKTKQEIGSIPTPFAWDSSGRDPEAPAAAPRTATATTADVLKLSGLSGAEPGSVTAALPTSLGNDGTSAVKLSLDVAGSGLLTNPKAKFPVFVDPTLIAGWKAWTFVSKKHPNSNFINGTNYNNGTTEARVGYESDTGVTGRSFWRMGFDKNIHDADIDSATFEVTNTHSWSCSNRSYQFYYTGAISSSTTWNSQPKWTTLQSTRSFAHGYSSSCPNDGVSFSVLSGAKVAAAASATTITLGMRSVSESDTETWRKFAARTAELTVVYNHPPAQPYNGSSSPGGTCVAGGTGVVVAKTDIKLTAYAKDTDGDLKNLRFRFWKTGGTVPAGTLVKPAVDTGKATYTVASTALADAATYSWDVRSEDGAEAVSTWFPDGTDPCRLTVDASAPAAPEVTSDVWLEETGDGSTWATVNFGQTGPITFYSKGATKFTFSFEGVDSETLTTTTGTATKTNLAPRHAGPTTILAYAYDALGNRSQRTDYSFYVPPGALADKPHDIGGDGVADMMLISASGYLRMFAGDEGGEIYKSLASSYNSKGKLNPDNAKHFYDATTGKAALITVYNDAYPGDGLADLFVRTPTNEFYLYPGDGYGSFNVDKRIRVLLPSNAPAPSTWTTIKAIGDITGDGMPDLAVQAGTAFWVFSGYTGASFQTATLMEGTAWALTARELVNIADIDLDGTPDLLWRNVVSGAMYIRAGLPGTVAGSVSLDSIKIAANSKAGADTSYGTGWTNTGVTAVVGIPDVNGDKIPDLWARSGTDGQIRVYYCSTTNTNAAAKNVMSADWSTVKAFG